MGILFAKTGTITTQNLVPAGVATTGSAVEIDVNGNSTIAIQVVGTYTGALSLQGTIDGTVWVTVSGTPLLNLNTGTSLATITSALQSILQADVTGLLKARITGLAAMTGTATVTIQPVSASAIVSVVNPIPAGAATLGTVNLGTGGTGATSLGKAEDAAHTSGDTGVAMWGVRYESTTAPNAASDYSLVQVDDLGKTVEMPYAPPVNQLQGITAAMTATADTSVLAAAGASVRNYVTGIHVLNTHATVATEVQIKDGSTVLDRFYVAAAGGEKTREYPTPLKGTANTAINAANVTTGSNTYVQAVGFRAV